MSLETIWAQVLRCQIKVEWYQVEMVARCNGPRTRTEMVTVQETNSRGIRDHGIRDHGIRVMSETAGRLEGLVLAPETHCRQVRTNIISKRQHIIRCHRMDSSRRLETSALVRGRFRLRVDEKPITQALLRTVRERKTMLRAPIAQLDRASAYEAEGFRFDP